MNTYNFFTLAAIQTGAYICVSAIMGGHILFTQFGFKGAILGLIFGSLILWIVGLILARLAWVRQKILVDLVQDYFGQRGAQICGLAFGVSCVGWFAIQLEMMSKGVNLVFPNIPVMVSNIVFGALITLNVLKGMKWMGKLADWSVPFLLFMMIYILVKAYDPSVSIPYSSWIQDGYWGGIISPMSLTIALSIAGVIDTPTYFCVSRSEKDAYIAITIIYLVILPLIALIGLFLSIYAQTDDFVKTIMGLGGTQWQFFMMCFLVLAGWTTNNGNLYSASMAIESCLKRSYRQRTSLLGLMGGIFACLGVLENFCETLSAMSITVGSLGAALIGRFLWDKLIYIPVNYDNKKYYFLIIIMGTSIGFIGHFGYIIISGSGFMDAFVSTIFLTCLYEGGTKWFRKSIQAI